MAPRTDTSTPPAETPSLEPALAQGRLSVAIEALATRESTDVLRLRDLFESLTGRGHAASLVVLSLASPIPAVGLALGLLLSFIGLRIAFGHRPWLPRWMLEKPIRRETLLTLARRLARFELRTHKMLRPRLVALCRDPNLHRVNGILVAVLGVLVTLPIPFTNILAAVPILLIGLGMLEDDGVFVLFGYAAAFFVFGLFAAVFWVGKAGIDQLIEGWRHRWI